MSNRIAFISPSDPNDKDAGSGTNYYIFQNLKKFGEVIYLDPFKIKYDIHLKIINRISRYLLKKEYNYYFSVRNSKRLGSHLTKTLADNRFNLIFAPFGCMQLVFC